MSNTVEEIKERLSIEEVVSQYVKLSPAGSNLKGLCPFHQERSPSFMVSPGRNSYHCFGCGVGGDIFSFIEGIEGLDFKGALKVLADKAGVEIKYDKNAKKTSDKKDTYYALLEEATNFFAEKLSNHSDAKEYLKGRGFNEETISNFRLGYAPDSWDDLLDYLKAKNYTDTDIEAVGLAIKNEEKNRYYNRFRSRIMFPIADSVGRVVAYSGRIIGAEQNSKDMAKYINSPETSLYHKSKILYGFDKAKQPMRRNDFAIIVEGQMDLVASHQAGFPNTVAISGTALTPEHVQLISRMTKKIVLAQDGDSAGIASAMKSAHMALRNSFDVKVVNVPKGKDPADIIRDEGEEVWKKYIGNATHIVEFLLKLFRAKQTDERAFKLSVEKYILPFIHDIQSPIDKEHFLGKIAKSIHTSIEAVKSSLSTVKVENTDLHPATQNTSTAHKKAVSVYSLTERTIGIYLWQKELDTKKVIEDIDNLKKEILETVDKKVFKQAEEKLLKDSKLFFILENIYKDKEMLEHDIESFISRLKKKKMKNTLTDLTEQMRGAEGVGDTKKIEDLLKKTDDLRKKIAEL